MKRALALLAPAALTVALVACGDDDDDEEPATTAESETEVTVDAETQLTLPDVSLPDITLPDITIPDISIPDLSDITIPDISLPDLSGVTLPENAEELLQQVFPGLDDEQLNCLVDEMGSDFDPQQAMDLMDECNIEVSDLVGG